MGKIFFRRSFLPTFMLPTSKRVRAAYSINGDANGTRPHPENNSGGLARFGCTNVLRRAKPICRSGYIANAGGPHARSTSRYGASGEAIRFTPAPVLTS